MFYVWAVFSRPARQVWGDDPQPIIVPHVPKTAGTSLRTYLAKVFGERLVLEYAFIPLPDPTPSRRLLCRLGSSRAALPRNIGALVGHFPADKYERALPSARYAVWLRDPVDRVVSHFSYYQRNPQWAPERWRGATFDEFLSEERERNRQSKQLAGRPLSAFDFVGVTESFAESIAVFARCFDLPPPDKIPRANVNPERRTSAYEISAEMRERILAGNRDDQALYEQARQRYSEIRRIVH